MKVIVAGSRDFTNTQQGFHVLDILVKGATEIVSGGARGADKIGEEYAKVRGIPLRVFPADWGKYGKSAGYKRNELMAKYVAITGGGMLIAFWDGESKGTGHMINLAKANKLTVKVVRLKRAK